MNQLNQILIVYLTTPASDFYLSKMLAKSKDPSLEPFKASDVNAGSLDFFGQTIGIRLTNLSIAGLTNIQIEKDSGGKANITINGEQVTFVADRPNTEAPPVGVPSKLTATGEIIIVAGGEDSPAVPVTITVNTGQLTGTFDATGDPTNPGSVNIQFTSLGISTEADASNIVVDLSKLDSVFKPQVEELLQKPSTLADLVEKLNDQVNASSVLAAVSTAGTQAAQQALNSVMG